MNKNWGAIRRINSARAARKSLAGIPKRPALQSPEEVDLVSDEGMDDGMQIRTDDGEVMDTGEAEPGPEGMGVGGGGEGKGTAIQDGMSILRHIPVKSVTICYEHRQIWKMRNRLAGEWINTPLAGGTSVVANQLAYRSIMTDEHVIPSHTLGFYLTPYEMMDFYHPRWRTFKLHDAGFQIEQVQVLPNVLQGTTDLRYAAPLGINPYGYVRGPASREYPLWNIVPDDQDGSVPGNRTFFAQQLAGFEDNAGRAKEDGGNAYALQLGYVTRYGASGDGFPPTQTTLVQFSGTKNYRLNRDWDIRPVTNFAGYTHKTPTWSKSIPMPRANKEDTFAFGQVTYNNMTHVAGGSTQKFENDSNQYGRSGQLSDVRGMAASYAERNFMTQDMMNHFPVGPMWNSALTQGNSNDGLPGQQAGKMMPFCMKMQNVPSPDGQLYDYTTTITLRSKICCTFDLDHTGGNSISVPNMDSVLLAQASGVAIHSYGGGAIQGFLFTNHNNAAYAAAWSNNATVRGSLEAPPQSDTVLLQGLMNSRATIRDIGVQKVVGTGVDPTGLGGTSESTSRNAIITATVVADNTRSKKPQLVNGL